MGTNQTNESVMKLPSIRISQLTKEQETYLYNQAVSKHPYTDYYVVHENGSIYQRHDSTIIHHSFYPVATYEDFIEQWNQIKLMNLL